MFIWGSKSEFRDLGVAETKHCETCGAVRPFKTILTYKLAHIWYLFTWVTGKKYHLACDVCNRGNELDAKGVEEKLGANPIPVRKRFGWVAIPAVIGALMVVGAIGSAQKEEEDQVFLSSPMINDLYVADLNHFLKKPGDSPAYGVLKVTSVAGDVVKVKMSKTGFSKVKGADKAVSNGAAADDSYYDSEELTIPKSELTSLRDKAVLHSVHRR
jgi:hypothetical protein